MYNKHKLLLDVNLTQPQIAFSVSDCFVCVYLFSVFVFLQVLTAAVTQASLQSMLHKLLTAGPSAFNVTTLLSQAAQLSTQGMAEVPDPLHTSANWYCAAI